ncbi:MAG: phosphoglucosamine mutase [Planctomycetes bacterium]|nr:phosphoglucosamine mutase [Planctomycetota bacterium]
MSEPIISVSGLRGVVGRSLTPETVLRYACALAAGLPDGPIVLTRDGRATGRMLADVVRGALCAAGRTVIDAGIAATPTTGVLVRSYAAAGGVQISASHNPAEYNGMKLFSPCGRVLDAAAGSEVLRRYREGDIAWVEHGLVGDVQACPKPIDEHLRLVLKTVDAEAIRQRGFRVLLDANHGAGSIMGRRFLESLGCETIILGGEPDGLFDHPPEPTAENLESVCRRVAESEVEVGFCQDPDADRLAIIDADGRYLGEEYTLAICLDHVLQLRPGPVVINCATSRMNEDIARNHAAPLFRTAVGEANVVEVMLTQTAVFGGEGNGGPINPQVGYVRDSFVGMATALEAMAVRDRTIAELADDLPRYEIHKTKMAVDREKIPAVLTELERRFPEATADYQDGLRLDFPESWLLVRASNTEPIIRAIAEAKTHDEAVRLCAQAAEIIAAG